jgi:hypothetical protein
VHNRVDRPASLSDGENLSQLEPMNRGDTHLYKAFFQKGGYADQTVTVVVNSREMTDLKISLQKL